MARSVQKLKALSIERLAKKPGLYSDGGGLCLRVSSPTARSWVMRYMLNKKSREMGLGSYPDVSLTEAREKAAGARKLKADGKDPIAARESERAARRFEEAKAMTFKEAAEGFIAENKDVWKNAKHAKQWEFTLGTYVYPVFGSVSVAEVDIALVLKALRHKQFWFEKPETASRVRGRIEAILAWATVSGYRKGENPARWKGHLSHRLPARAKLRDVKHHAALPYSEIGTFMAQLETEESTGALALAFTILTAARTGEVTGATWDEIDFFESLWTVPAARMKKRKESTGPHRVPLSKQAVNVLRRVKEFGNQGPLIFPGATRLKTFSPWVMLKILSRAGFGHLTVHGFRSTFRDWAAERTNFPSEVAEAALAHVIENKVEAAYRRGDLFEKRRRLMVAWATFCATSAPQARVIQIRKAAS